MKNIPLSTPNLNIEIVENLRECVETGWVSTGGRFISEFEEKIANYVGVPKAVGCQSGTSGLHTALRILDINPSDEVIVPTLTFIAAVNPVRYQFANPIFMDCDDNLCIDPVKLASFCSEECHMDENNTLINNSTNAKIKAIILVHIFGNLADINAIAKIASKYNLKIVEDATEALGSFWIEGDGRQVHAGTVGDIGVFSFNANKIITTGGGGMIVSKNIDYLNKASYLTTTAKNDSLYFVHDEVGYNYRMLNLQAALGVSQIDELETFIETKVKNYNRYCELLNDIDSVKILPFTEGIRSNHWFYSLYINDDNNHPNKRDYIMHSLIEKGVQCRPIWKLIHTQKPYESSQSYLIEKALDYEKHVLNLPCSTNLSTEDVDYVCDLIANLLK